MMWLKFKIFKAKIKLKAVACNTFSSIFEVTPGWVTEKKPYICEFPFVTLDVQFHSQLSQQEGNEVGRSWDRVYFM
jgi:hypothetical protein